MRIQLLFLKTEALYLVEVLASLERDHIVCADASHGLGCGVAGCVEC